MGAATVIAGVTAIAGAAKAISGAKQKRDGKRAARRFKRQVQKNTAENLRVSSLGADLAREEGARATASTVDALQAGGIRGSVGGAAGVVGANNDNSRRIGANLDMQQRRIDEAIAADERRIQGVQENRDNAELNNIQQQVNAGNQQMWSGLGDVASAAGGFAAAGGFEKGGLKGNTTTEQMQNYQAGANSVRGFGKIDNSVFTGNDIDPRTGLPYGTV
tara:strand:+ start:15432 stop:16088 length:657 start_codon:yes stop_codon:yes gene_type:complete